MSDDLRRKDGAFLRERRRLAALTLSSMASLGVVAAYQLGLIRRPPEPRLPFLDAERVDATGEAYELLKTPDAALGLASAATTLVLVGMRDHRRSTTAPLIPLAMAGKIAIDALFAAYLTAEQGSKHKRYCSWCLMAALASIASVPFAVPEARAAWRTMSSRG